MKKILTSLALLGAITTGAYAQKEINIAISNVFPEANATYDNLAEGDTFYCVTAIANNGTVAIDETDTIKLWYLGLAEGTDGEQYWFYGLFDSLSIAPGASDTVSLAFVKGQVIGTTQAGVDVSTTVPNDANWTFHVEGYGFDNTNTPFNDPDVNQDAPDDDGSLTGDNAYDVNFTFGVPAGIFEIEGLTKVSLEIFPNPATSVVNVNYNFTATTPASIRISDVTGRVVLNQDLGKQNRGAQQFSVDVSTLNNGMYTMELVTDQQRAISKLTISK